MAELFLEIFCEEIPARMQAKAERDLSEAVTKGLKEAGLSYGTVTALSGPRRLAVSCADVPAGSDDVTEERKGPKVGAPEQAVQGFLRGAGLSSIDEAEVRSDPKKGDFYVASRTIPGRATADIVAELVPDVMRNFHWPKSMRTGRGEMRWVRPLQRIVCVYDGAVIPFEVDGIASGNETEGHRVHGRGPYTVTGLADYSEQLSGAGHVLLTRDARRTKIETDAKAICAKHGLELVEDKGLLEEVVGLAEWPQVILGEMDPAFLELPPEVIQLSMRTHQKYFAVRDPKTGNLAPNFVVVANIAAVDGGKAIAAGNRKVLSARLEDGRFFWENDKKTGLERAVPLKVRHASGLDVTKPLKLEKITFKDGLGTIADKVRRSLALALWLRNHGVVEADAELVRAAAYLMKSDLVTEMVYEFPELQGVMGRYYALEAGEPDAVANAIREHYRPQGPSDTVPNQPVSVIVALADKLDTLIGFWAIDEKPTGSKDPFALRRNALGVIRLILENNLRLKVAEAILAWFAAEITEYNDEVWQLPMFAYSYPSFDHVAPAGTFKNQARKFQQFDSLAELAELDFEVEGIFLPSDSWIQEMEGELQGYRQKDEIDDAGSFHYKAPYLVIADLLAFFADRLKQYLRDQGQRHDLIDAVFALGEDDLVLIVKRVEALAAFLDTEDGTNLLAGYKRAANILRAEEKKDKCRFDGAVKADLFAAKAEKDLFETMTASADAAQTALKAEDFEGAMTALASLRAPVDAFFDGPDSVMVNADDAAVRENRLNLLNMMREALGTVADFSKISG